MWATTSWRSAALHGRSPHRATRAACWRSSRRARRARVPAPCWTSSNRTKLPAPPRLLGAFAAATAALRVHAELVERVDAALPALFFHPVHLAALGPPVRCVP